MYTFLWFYGQMEICSRDQLSRSSDFVIKSVPSHSTTFSGKIMFILELLWIQDLVSETLSTLKFLDFVWFLLIS